jgi:Zn-dependent protease with chaperone function
VAAALGTVVTTGAALGALLTFLPMAQVMLTTNIELDSEYWAGVLPTRCWTALAAAFVIVFGVAIFRTVQLFQGGGRELARQLGGTLVWQDARHPKHRQLLNVVEELSLASGVSTPKVFVLENETGINAFAAGIHPKDTVVGVTQGALDRLNREQMQGVLAHEFSHILNGDVRLNLQTLGMLQGIEAISSLANYFLRIGSVRRLNSIPLAAFFGYVLWPIGAAGVFFGSLAKMSVSRQREYLADAAAVQFTRNAQGLASVLKLILGHDRRGDITSNAGQAASHLFFVRGASPLSGLLESHPPLEERILRLEPDWDGTIETVMLESAAPWTSQADALFQGADARAPKTQPVLPVGREVQPDALLEPCSALARQGDRPTPASALEQENQVGESREESEDAVSEEDRQAFLETLASVRANSSRRAYDVNSTHWPTLIATGVAVLCLAGLFTWYTAPDKKPKTEKTERTRYVRKERSESRTRAVIEYVSDYMDWN